MKIKKVGLFAGVAALCGVFLAPNTFATNPYGIEYSGGTQLGASNVNIEPELVGELAPLVTVDSKTTYSYSNSNIWQDGYIHDYGFIQIVNVQKE